MTIDSAAAAPKTDAVRELLRSATIGRYDIYAELGRGGMAAVYLALDLALERKVAIKAMLPETAGGAGAIERFRREAKLAASLSHPHIIPIFGVGDTPSLAYFIMKYVEGRSLDSVLKTEGPQSPPFVRAIVQQVGSALDYAHSRNITHRDVKPANIMLDEGGWALLADFGIAKADDGMGLTTSGMIIGTPNYMSPEHFSTGTVGAAADQYALGVVAFELLTGRLPFTGKSVAELMRAHVMDEPPSVREFVPSCPPILAAVIARMLAKNVADRFPTLADASNAIGPIQQGELDVVRTQMTQFAKSGAGLRPGISVPISPIPDPEFVRKNIPASQSRVTDAAVGAAARPSLKRISLMAASVVAIGLLGLYLKSNWSTLSKPDVVADTTKLAGAPASLPPAGVAQKDSATPNSATRPDAPKSTNVTQSAARQIPTKPGTPTNSIANAPPPAATAPDSTGQNRVLSPDTQPPPVVAPPIESGVATVRIGTRNPDAYLFLNGKGRRLSAGALQSFSVPSGEVRVRLEADDCAPWGDTLIVLKPGEIADLRYKNPRCNKFFQL